MDSIQFDGFHPLGVNIVSFLNFRRVDYKFLNFRVKIEKILKLYRLKVNFSLILIGLKREVDRETY
jgi:hypothetical protein